MKLFWLSFCDPDRPKGEQFLGAAIVEAATFEEAVPVSWIMGCNPGGEVMIVELSEEGRKLLKKGDMFRLFDKETLSKKEGWGPLDPL